MPCMSTNNSSIYTYSLSSSGSSISYGGYLSTTYAYLSATTLMFGGTAEIKNGTIYATNLFLNDSAKLTFGKDLKITGDVYLVSNEDYNNIWWTWSNSAMEKYLTEHNIKPVHYQSEDLSSHYSELVSMHNNHVTDSDHHA